MINNFEKKTLWNGFETNFLIIFSQKYRYTNPTIVPVIWKYPKSNKKLATLKKMTYENRENKEARDHRRSFPEKYWTFDSLLFLNQFPSRQFWKPKIRFWSLSNLKEALWLFDLISSRAFRWIREKVFVLWRIWGWAKAHVDWFVPLVFYYKSLPVE